MNKCRGNVRKADRNAAVYDRLEMMHGRKAVEELSALVTLLEDVFKVKGYLVMGGRNEKGKRNKPEVPISKKAVKGADKRR